MSLKSIQQALADHAYSPGAIDDRWGPKTEAAMQAVIAAKGARGGAVVDAIPIITRAIQYQGKARYPINEIVVHCSATAPDWMAGQGIAAKKAEINRWHLARGFAMIGYHWIIDRDGKMLACRPETQIGAHVIEANRGTIGICLIGGFGSSATDGFSDNFTSSQDVQLRHQISGISMRTQIRRISGHNEYARKACPGFDVPTWLAAA